MADTPENPSGTDIAAFGISLDSRNAEKSAESFTEVVIKAGDATVSLGDKAENTARRLDQSRQSYQGTIDALLRLQQEEERYKQVQIELNQTHEKLSENAQALIVKLNELITRYGLTTTELYRLEAAQLNVSRTAEPLIQHLETLRQASMLYGRQIKSLADIEEAQAAAQTSLNAQRIRALNDQARLEESARTALEAQRRRAMAENRAEALRILTEQEEAQKKAIEEETKTRVIFEAFKRRTMAENRAEAIRMLEEQEQKAVALAEKQAMEEIKWNQLSVKQRILQLEQLKAYQANSAIRPETIEKMFGSAAIADLPNLIRYQQEYAAALEAAGKAHGVVTRGAKDAAEATNGVRIQTSRATSELLVLGREASVGNFTRFAGSATILAQALGMTLNPLTALVGLVAAFTVQAVKGSIEQDKFNNAIISTGNYAGTTVGNLDEMTNAIGRSHGAFKDAAKGITQLTASGKFTEDQIRKIAEAAVEMEHASGKSIEKTIAEFESLAVTQTHSNLAATQAVTQAAAKLDSQYHFLTSSILEQIAALEKDGNAKEASRVAMNALAEATKSRAAEMVENLGYVAKAWNSIRKLIGDVLHDLNEVGKKATAASEVTRLQAIVKDLEGGGGTTFGVYNEASRIQKLAEAREQLAKAQAQLNKENANAANQGERAAATTQAVQAAAAILEEETRIGKRTMSEYEQAVARYHEQLKQLRAEDTGEVGNPLLTQEAIAKHEEMLKKAYLPKEKAAPNDGRKQVLLTELEDAQSQYNKTRQATEAINRFLSEMYRNGLIESQAYYSALANGREVELEADQKMYEIKTTALQKYNARNAVDAKEVIKRIQEVAYAYREEQARIRNEGALIDLKQSAEEKKAVEDSIKNITKAGEKDVENLERRIQKQKEYNLSIAGNKVAHEEAQKAADKAMLDRNIADAAYLEEMLRSNNFTAEVNSVYRARISWLNQVIEKQQELSKAQSEGIGLEEAKAQAEAYSKSLQMAVKSAHEFEKGMTTAFGSVGKALGELVVTMAEYAKRQDEIDQNYWKKIQAANGNEMEISNANEERQNELLKNRVGTYASLADASKGFFDEQSKGYKLMDGLSKTFHAAQAAMNLIEMGQLAIKAVLNQASQGDPYTAWARMAAMAAAVAALGFAVGGGFNTTSGDATSARDRQKMTGTGTVLGGTVYNADGTVNRMLSDKSDSINKALNILSKNSDITLPINQAMLKSLQNIENSMAGLAVILFRTYGLTSGNPLGIREGEVWRSGQSGMLNSALNSLSGGLWSSLAGLWGKTTKEITDSGLLIGGTSVGNLTRGGGVSQYTDVKTTDSSWFGLKKDVSYDRSVQEAPELVKQQLGKVFKNVEDSVAKAAVAIGYDTEEHARQWIENIQFTQGNLSMRGLKGQELQDALNAYISNMTDQIAKSTVPVLQEFQRVGEGYLETLMRVASGVQEAQGALDKLGMSAVNYQSISQKQGDVAAEIVRETILQHEKYGDALTGVGKIMENLQGSAQELADTYKALINIQRQMSNAFLNGSSLSSATISGAGGVKELSSALNVYQDKFFTDAEKASALRLNVQQDFAKLGYSSAPVTREQFRALVQSIDTTTAAGQKLQGQVLALADEFDKATTAAEQVAAAEKAAADEAASAAQKIKDAWQNITNSIVDEINRIRGLVTGDSGQSYAQLQAKFALTTAQARAGDQDAAKLLPQVSQDLLRAAETQAKSLEELNYIRATTANSLEDTVKGFGRQYGTIPQFASGGDFEGGIRMVGETGREIEVTGPSRIFNATQTSNILNGGLKEEIQALREEVRRLRVENNANQQSIARNAEKTAKVLTRNDTPNGLLISNTLPV